MATAAITNSGASTESIRRLTITFDPISPPPLIAILPPFFPTLLLASVFTDVISFRTLTGASISTEV